KSQTLENGNEVEFVSSGCAGEDECGPDLGRHPEIRHPDFTGIDGGHPRPPCGRAQSPCFLSSGKAARCWPPSRSKPRTPKLPCISGAETVKALKKLGFDFLRQNGSHPVLRLPQLSESPGLLQDMARNCAGGNVLNRCFVRYSTKGTLMGSNIIVSPQIEIRGHIVI